MTGNRVKLWGPPGTGKTRRLIEICEQEMSRGRASGEIIFCSFTKAAAHEARDRAIARFGGTPENYPWFSTEHSICYRLLGIGKQQVLNRHKLREFGSKYHYVFFEEAVQRLNEDTGEVEERFSEAWLKTVADYYEAFVSFMANRCLGFDAAYSEFLGYHSREDLPDDWSRAGVIEYIERRERYKQENNLWSFDDMITRAIERDIFPQGAKVLIVDECQDSSPLLYSLIRRWASKVESYYLASDPLQAIYGFSGAAPELFFEFPGEQQVLNHSFRLTPQVKGVAQKIIERTKLTFPAYSAADRTGIVERKQFVSIKWGQDNSFLLARTRWFLSLYADELRARGIPFKVERGRHSPLTDSRGRAFYTLFKISEGENVSSLELANLMKHTGRPWLEWGAKKRISNLVEGDYWGADLPKMGFTEDFMTAVGHGDFTNVLCRDFDPDDKTYLRRVLKKVGPSAFEEEPKLVLTTIHGSKGREKPTVYLCPDLTRRVWDAYCRDRNPESLVFYVGVTRAVDRLVILTTEQDYSFPLPRKD
jgi:superfamily I DNA/RNA helicase